MVRHIEITDDFDKSRGSIRNYFRSENILSERLSGYDLERETQRALDHCSGSGLETYLLSLASSLMLGKKLLRSEEKEELRKNLIILYQNWLNHSFEPEMVSKPREIMHVYEAFENLQLRMPCKLRDLLESNLTTTSHPLPSQVASRVLHYYASSVDVITADLFDLLIESILEGREFSSASAIRIRNDLAILDAKPRKHKGKYTPFGAYDAFNRLLAERKTGVGSSQLQDFATKWFQSQPIETGDFPLGNENELNIVLGMLSGCDFKVQDHQEPMRHCKGIDLLASFESASRQQQVGIITAARPMFFGQMGTRDLYPKGMTYLQTAFLRRQYPDMVVLVLPLVEIRKMSDTGLREGIKEASFHMPGTYALVQKGYCVSLPDLKCQY